MVKQKSAIRASKDLIGFLKHNANYGESLEQVMWRFIFNIKLTEENKQSLKEAKKNYDQFL